MRSFMPPSLTSRRSGGGGAIWATGLPWRVMTTFSPSSTARISSGKRFLASAMLTSMLAIIARNYGHSKNAMIVRGHPGASRERNRRFLSLGTFSSLCVRDQVDGEPHAVAPLGPVKNRGNAGRLEVVPQVARFDLRVSVAAA